MTSRLELLPGTLDMLVLQVLAWGSQHGYGITQALRTRSNDVLQVETGSLYPALQRLEKQGWIDSEWRTSDKGQRAKYYELTRKGKKQLIAEQQRWTTMSRVITGLMTGDPA